MVAPAGVPLLKLGLLAVKQIAKPIANRAKVAAKDSAAFKGVVVWVGRSLHRLTIQMSRMADGKVSLEYITPLREEAAVDRGAEFVSELVIYSIAASTTIYEFTRQQQDKKKKEREAELDEIRIKHEALANERRQWEAFSDLNRRMTLLDEQLLDLRREASRSWYDYLFGSTPSPKHSSGER